MLPNVALEETTNPLERASLAREPVIEEPPVKKVDKEQGGGSRWLAAIQREHLDRFKRERAEAEARAARLSTLFEEASYSDSEDDYLVNKLDAKAARENLSKFLEKID